MPGDHRRRDGEEMSMQHSRPKPRPWQADHQKARMNGIEADYAKHLDRRKRDGEVVSWMYHAIRLHLAERVWYMPCFMIVKQDVIELHEVVGAQFKACADRYPMFKFVKIERVGKGWTEEVYK